MRTLKRAWKKVSILLVVRRKLAPSKESNGQTTSVFPLTKKAKVLDDVQQPTPVDELTDSSPKLASDFDGNYWYFVRFMIPW